MLSWFPGRAKHRFLLRGISGHNLEDISIVRILTSERASRKRSERDWATECHVDRGEKRQASVGYGCRGGRKKGIAAARKDLRLLEYRHHHIVEGELLKLSTVNHDCVR